MGRVRDGGKQYENFRSVVPRGACVGCRALRRGLRLTSPGQWARCARELSGGARAHSKLPVMLDTAQVPGTELRGGGSPVCCVVCRPGPRPRAAPREHGERQRTQAMARRFSTALFPLGASAARREKCLSVFLCLSSANPAALRENLSWLPFSCLSVEMPWWFLRPAPLVGVRPTVRRLLVSSGPRDVA